MNIGLDGVNLGPLTRSWMARTPMLGLLTCFALARFGHAERAAIVTLIVARLWDALPGLDTSQPALQNVLDIVDVRRGGWPWIPGVVTAAAEARPTRTSGHTAHHAPPHAGRHDTHPLRTGYVVNFWTT